LYRVPHSTKSPDFAKKQNKTDFSENVIPQTLPAFERLAGFDIKGYFFF